jgi:hypothetical protein
MAIPNLALIPTGYKAGKVYSVLPESGVGDFTFTRASAATRINSAGLLEVPQYSIGGELVTNGSFATDTDWTKGTGWTISGGKAVSNSSVGFQSLSQSNAISNSNGKTFKCNFTISGYSSGLVALYISGFINNSYFIGANGDYEIYIMVSQGTSGNVEFLTNSLGFVGSIDNLSIIEWAINDVPRLEYPLIDGVVNGCPSLLLEPQATNLITYPISFGNSYWTKSGASIEGDASTAGAEIITNVTDRDFSGVNNWTNNGLTSFNSTGDLSISAGAAGQYASLPVTDIIIEPNKFYLLEYDVANITGAGFTFLTDNFVSLSNNIQITVDGTNNRIYFYSNKTTNSGLLIYSNLGAASADFDNFSLKEVQGYSSPSVDFPTSAFKLVEGVGYGRHELYSPDIATSFADWTQSFYVKYSGRQWVYIWTEIGSFVWFDVLNGVVGTEQGTSNGNIEELTNGYYRCSATWTEAVATNRVRLGMSDADAVETYTGDGTSGVYLFMAQFETGSYATSPTLTSLSAEGTTTTRVAEVCNGAGDASTFNDSEGVLMAEISALANDGTYRALCISGGSASNRVLFYINNTTNVLRMNIVSGGVAQANVSINVSDVTASNKLAVKYSLSSISFWINGTKFSEISNASAMPTGLNELAFDSNGLGNEPLYGKTKQIQYFNTVLTSAELETLTSWTSFISMANAQQFSLY